MEKGGDGKKKRLTIRKILDRHIKKIPGMTRKEKWALINLGAQRASQRIDSLKKLQTGISLK